MYCHCGITATNMHGRPWSHPDASMMANCAYALGYPDNLLCRDLGNLRRFFGSHIFQGQIPPFYNTACFYFLEGFFINCCTGFEPVLTICKITNKISGPKAFGENNMGHGGSQGSIGPRQEWQPLMGFGRRGIQLRINHCYSGMIQDISHPLNRCRYHSITADRITTPNQNIFRITDIVVTVAPCPFSEIGAEFLCLGTNR